VILNARILRYFIIIALETWKIKKKQLSKEEE